MGNFARARERYEAVLASPRATETEKAEVLARLDRTEARHLYEAGRYAEAARRFERMLEGFSAGDAYWCGWMLWLAGCYREMGAHTAARDCYAEILRAPGATESEKTDARRNLDGLNRQS